MKFIFSIQNIDMYFQNLQYLELELIITYITVITFQYTQYLSFYVTSRDIRPTTGLLNFIWAANNNRQYIPEGINNFPEKFY